MNKKEAESREASDLSVVKTAKRTLDVFEAFARCAKPMTLTELADEIGSPMSSCHALLKTLLVRGYFYALDNRSFYPSRKMLDIASEIARQDPLLRQVTQIMASLSEATQETIILGKRTGNSAVYLEVIEGTHLISYRERVGASKPLHSSAVGKSILGSLDEAELDKLLAKLPLEKRTETTIVDPKILKSDIIAGTQRGYHRTQGENAVDVEAIAIAFSLSGELLSLAIAGPLERMRRNEDKYAEILAGTISGLLESHTPSPTKRRTPSR